MTDAEIDEAVETACDAIEGEWLERGSGADQPAMEAKQAQALHLGQYAKALRDENARLREIAQAVAEGLLYTGVNGDTYCLYCNGMGVTVQAFTHESDCLVMKARALPI